MAQSPWTPISILGNYAQDVRELSFFDGTMHGSYPNYLSAAQMQSVFPGGFIVRPQFTFQGREYRLTRAKDPMTDRLLYLALETDDAPPDSRPPSRTLFASPSFPTGGKADPRRAPLQSHSPWNAGFDEQEQQPSAYPPTAHQQLDLPPRSHSANGYHHPLASPTGFTPFASGRETPPQPHFVPPPTPFHSLIPHSHKFAQDMIIATSSQVPLERYKALVALMSILRREMQQGQVADTARPECWEAANALSLLKSIVLVGECLAKFGSADFNEGSNTVRAITTKDYATLLRQYLQTYGFIYNQDFIAGISDVALQDDMMTVCNLLQTRCEANDLLFGQLIKHVGLEGSSKGAATVYNSTVVTSNPTTSLTCNPTSTTTSTSSAQARLKSLTSGSVWPFVVAAGGGLAMLLLKRKLGGGGGGGAGGEKGSKPRRKGRGSNIHSMLEGERLMVSTLASCQQELDRSRQNTVLLENDWRFGKLRLASPHNPLPPGFKEVDTQRCDLQEFYRQMRHEALLHEVAVSRDED